MAYKETSDLGCDKTYALGGIRTDKKTQKKFKNPKEVEGYYIGTKKGIDTGQDKPSNLHLFEGEVKNDKGEVIYTGKVGIWGKTDLDRKAGQWKVGLMTKAYFDKMQDPNQVKGSRKPMYLYKSFQDPENVNLALVEAAGEAGQDVYEEEGKATAPAGTPAEEEVTEEEVYEEEGSIEEEAPAADEPAPKPAQKPAKPAAPAADRQAAMQKLMAKPAAKTA